MSVKNRTRLWRCLARATVVASVIVPNLTLSAQVPERPSSVGGIFKGVVIDPTTYAPALISYDATMRDWTSSQPFFRHGYGEANARFTRTGVSNGRAVSYAVGRRQIRRDTLGAFGVSAVHNTAGRILEQVFIAKFPNHRRVVRTMGWIERIGVGSMLSYQRSAAHYRQAALNAEGARRLRFQ